MGTEWKPFLTIGMPTYDDRRAVAFTVQALREYHLLDRNDVEILVIDNKPDDTECERWVKAIGDPRVRYERWADVPGPAGAKNKVFELARGEFVVCIDSHVFLGKDSVRKIIRFYHERPNTNDLYTGPMVYDPLGDNISSHFDPVWRGGMWGIWALDKRARDINAEPFEVWGNGCGFISARRQAWLDVGGFHPKFRGFGGEEGYIHEKFRKAGHKVWCVPFMRWWHNYLKDRAPTFPLIRWHKVRNFVLGHLELGIDLDGIYQEFVIKGEEVRPGQFVKFPQSEWDALVDDPEREWPPQAAIHPTPGGVETIDSIYSRVFSTPRDLDQHMPKLKELAASVKHVTEFSHRKESVIAFVAGGPEKLVSFNSEAFAPEVQMLDKIRPIDLLSPARSLDIADIEPTDLLFIDTYHTYGQLLAELLRYSPRVGRFIVLHDTGSFGMRGEDGGAGLVEAIKAFLRDHREWFIAWHTHEQHGLTVLGRQERDKPETKIRIWPKGFGPGTELKRMLESYGVETREDCGCRGLQLQMDELGVEGCRTNFDAIADQIRKNGEKWEWLQKQDGKWNMRSKLKVGFAALMDGTAIKINPLDPAPGLLSVAIDRAEKIGEPEDAI